MEFITGGETLSYQGFNCNLDNFGTVIENKDKPISAEADCVDFYYFFNRLYFGEQIAKFVKTQGWLWKCGKFDFYLCRSGNGLGYYAYEGKSGYMAGKSFALDDLKNELATLAAKPEFKTAVEKAIKATGLSPLYKGVHWSE